MRNDKLQSVRSGMFLSFAAMALFALNDSLGKWLVASHPVGQVLVLRSLGALAVLVPVMVWICGIRAVWLLERPGIQVLRVVASSIEVACFYVAVRGMALADVMAFWLAAPIWVAVLAPIFLKERLGVRQILAIFVGFAGVLIILAPGSEGAIWPLESVMVALLGTIALAIMVLTGRSLRRTPDTVLAFWQLVGAALAGAALPLLSGYADLDWSRPSPFNLALLCGLGVVAMGAHLCLNRSVKLAPAALVAPVQYTLLLWAIILGWLFFGDLPTVQTLIGAAVIVGSGLYLVGQAGNSRR
jgi:drug/metabolite transporter (DMT)-like permease